MNGLGFFGSVALFAALLLMVSGVLMLDRQFPLSSLGGRLLRRLFPPSETLEGYDHPEVVEVVYRKTLSYKPTLPWPEIQGASTVLDFGGGCGLHYKHARSDSVRWAVVETEAMVRRAADLQTDRLRFFASIPEAVAWLGPVDVVHSDGALHFADDPHGTVKQLCGVKAPLMLWYRMYLSQGAAPERFEQTSHLVDNGPGDAPSGVKNKAVKYPYTKIPEADFIAAHEGYHLVRRGPDWFQFRAI